MAAFGHFRSSKGALHTCAAELLGLNDIYVSIWLGSSIEEEAQDVTTWISTAGTRRMQMRFCLFSFGTALLCFIIQISDINYL